MPGALIAAAATGVLVTLTPADDVALKDRTLRLSDVAVVSGPDAEAVNKIEIAELAGPDVTISRKDLARLIGRTVPAIRVAGALTGSIRVHAPASKTAIPPEAYLDGPQVRRGDHFAVTASVGPVTIERQVIALQDASVRQRRVFVRSSDGEVFATPVQPGVVK